MSFCSKMDIMSKCAPNDLARVELTLYLFFSPLFEHINEHIAHEGISNENQSAYRVFHSTETALLKIQNDIATSMDKGAAVGLVLLDLSAAFDTIDHSILFNCLQRWYGIDGVVLKWVQSYLNSCKQRIKIDGHL